MHAGKIMNKWGRVKKQMKVYKNVLDVAQFEMNLPDE
jgi:hypothetical protein